MKNVLSFEWLTKKNISEMDLIRRLLLKNYNLVDLEPEILDSVISGECKQFYPIIDYAIIKVNNKSVGLIGQYNSFLFKNDLWLGWAGILPEFHDKKKSYMKNAMKLWEAYVKKKYPNIDHLRAYISKSKEKDDLIYLKDLGYKLEKGMYKHYQDDDIIILSKCLKGEYRPWTRKPVW